jgi:hypothetical protein
MQNWKKKTSIRFARSSSLQDTSLYGDDEIILERGQISYFYINHLWLSDLFLINYQILGGLLKKMVIKEL